MIIGLENVDEKRMQAFNNMMMEEGKIAQSYNMRVTKKNFQEEDLVWKVILLMRINDRELGKWAPTKRAHSRFTKSYPTTPTGYLVYREILISNT